MERVYFDDTYSAKDEESNKYLLKSAEIQREAKEYLEENSFKKWVVDYHNYIRRKLDLPNKLFAFAMNTDKTKAYIVVFPKEPDGNYYEVFIDEETKKPYILVDETKE